ncbi:MAG TPA: hypothetical protein VGD15_16755 [Kribbella sp.]
MTDHDRAYLAATPGIREHLLYQVDARRGLTPTDFGAIRGCARQRRR